MASKKKDDSTRLGQRESSNGGNDHWPQHVASTDLVQIENDAEALETTDFARIYARHIAIGLTSKQVELMGVRVW